jgi:DNA-binding beta-propeller fold protein YncE
VRFLARLDSRRGMARSFCVALIAGTAACASGTASSGSTSVANGGAPAEATRPAGPAQAYLVFVAAEAVDRISLIRFEPGCASGACARMERETRIGLNPTEPNGPHGLAVSPDGRHYYVTTAHGFPGGSLWKLTLQGDTVKGTVKLGAFPATLQISPDGAFAYAVNFNLHGDMVPSSVSVVYLDDMIEVSRIRTCTMPHGSRLTADGSKHYSVCMMDDMLIEIDTRTMGLSRHFMLGRGREHGMSGAPRPGGRTGGGAQHDRHGMEPPVATGAGCSPTWAQPTADGSRIYVACSKSSDVVEVDGATWTVRRRIPMGDGVYNLALTRDGSRLIGTNKRGQSVSIVDIASGRELARIRTTRRLPSGVALSSDDRYAFVSVEGVGSEPGTVEVIDLRSLTTVATVDVGQMAGGIDFWKIEPPI